MSTKGKCWVSFQTAVWHHRLIIRRSNVSILSLEVSCMWRVFFGKHEQK